jgi:N6-L-threonylcarbamoyladenine synthase
MKILGIETSCDETAVAIVDDGKNIISNLTISQINLHKEFGGVVPEIAARSHAEILDGLIKKSLSDSNLKFNDLSAIAATAGPGLIGGVIVGLMMAKTIASVYKKPFLAINHLEAHALTARLTNNIEFPYLLLLVSGGHCQILLAKGVSKYEKIGQTLDDALGEAFDKVAQMLGLSYPGGPEIEKAALFGDENKYNFPQPLINSKENPCNFSFSGLKTAVRRLIEEISGHSYDHFLSNTKLTKQEIADICASFQNTVAKILINRLKNSLQLIAKREIKINNLIIAGGVSANQYLYKKISKFSQDYSIKTISPPIELCTDNAAMVSWAGIEKLRLKMTDNLNFKPKARWEIG